MELDHSIELHDSMAFFFSIKERLPTDNTSKASGLIELSMTIYGRANNMDETFKVAQEILKRQQALGKIPSHFGTEIPEQFEPFSLKRNKK